MSRFHNVNGEKIPFTQAEEDQRDAEEATYEANKPTKFWKQKMIHSDGKMPRSLEDIWDHLDIENAPQVTQDLHAAKKTLRGEKP